MSIIPLAEAKQFLDVIHSSDDAKLQALLDGAEREALNYMDREDFTELCPCESEIDSDLSSEEDTYGMPAVVRTAVLLLLQAVYQATPDEADKLRAQAETKLFPHRCKLGV